jgi:DNA gyrase/topoisomerase IV subunit B
MKIILNKMEDTINNYKKENEKLKKTNTNLMLADVKNKSFIIVLSITVLALIAERILI